MTVSMSSEHDPRGPSRSYAYGSLDSLFAPFREMLDSGHLRSGHPVRPSDPTAKQFCNRVTTTVV